MQQAMAMQAKIERLFRAASAVDVAFIVDITGSMDSWITAVKDQVANNGVWDFHVLLQRNQQSLCKSYKWESWYCFALGQACLCL